ncbi:SGNH/GDSL hydrolase family protein [Curtobacterium sp. MCSS17_016]|uniref:SGNH/GDSL hydrolase family protein n=1 Tax=Curtobacterium sp. MCSS17_016 TaxID=2175644 RepID=UPI0015E8CDAA|nr:SGNH/GDSL hydrolase family protein [Curtobacterium sp. MCSS17_016]WIE80444.1 SGNH/GDSL hydrolase family protein [Curtobacterium sp. MCSS17_016]
MRRLLTTALFLGLLAVLSAGVIVEPSSRDTVGTHPMPQAADPSARWRSLRVAIVGDSLSAGRSRFLGNGLDDETWMTYAVGDGIEFVGGWARSGATPDEMANAVRPIADVDVLVILAGTNAVRIGKNVADEAASYEQIVEVIQPEHVMVSSIPPYDAHGSAALTYNEDLHEFTTRKRWSWIDPWDAARDGLGWTQGFSTDGIHPAGPRQYAVLGGSFRKRIIEASRLPRGLDV